MPLSRRYTPEWSPGDTCGIGYDFAPIIPVGVGLLTGVLGIQTNSASPVDATADWTIGPVLVRGRAVYASLTGGVLGTDYQLHWTVNDTQGNIWSRVGLMLCGYTS